LVDASFAKQQRKRGDFRDAWGEEKGNERRISPREKLETRGEQKGGEMKREHETYGRWFPAAIGHLQQAPSTAQHCCEYSASICREESFLSSRVSLPVLSPCRSSVSPSPSCSDESDAPCRAASQPASQCHRRRTGHLLAHAQARRATKKLFLSFLSCVELTRADRCSWKVLALAEQGRGIGLHEVAATGNARCPCCS